MKQRKVHPDDYQELQLTYLANQLETIQAGYERQQETIDSSRKETLEWRTKHAVVITEAKMNRAVVDLTEKTSSQLSTQGL